jgi:hypothetical protein
MDGGVGNARLSVMDHNLETDAKFQLQQLTEQPTMDFHLRVTEHKAEALLWLDGRRYRLLGARDEEPDAPQPPA